MNNICYESHTFRKNSLALLSVLNEIMDDYRQQGFTLTLRQLYYQLVARDLIANTEKQYNAIGTLCNKGRMAGQMPWDIVDRTRAFIVKPHWQSEAEIIEQCATQYTEDMWQEQPCRLFVIIEKDALRGVIEGVCSKYDVPLLSARGYPSSSVLHSFAMERLIPAIESGQDIVILHLGDHDPSGIGMTEDMHKRLSLFTGDDISITRIGLTMDQVRELNPPPNPAKQTDTRYRAYVKQFKTEHCWELDALPPAYLVQLVDENISKRIVAIEWQIDEGRIKTVKADLARLAA